MPFCTAALTGGVAIVPMALMSLLSVSTQLTTAHHQEHVHVPALLTVAASCLVVAAVRGLAALLPRRPCGMADFPGRPR